MKNALFAIAISVTIAACNHQQVNEEFKAADNLAPAVADSTLQVQNDAAEKIEEEKPKEPSVAIPLEKKIVKTATISVWVDSLYNYRGYLKTLLTQQNGYFSKESQSQYSGQNTLIVSIKIPVEKFDDFIEKALRYQLVVEERSIEAQDVTNEYRDSKLMVDTKKRLRLRYLDMLSKARNVTEMLEVQQAIDGIQSEIDMYEGRAQYLYQTAAYSTINITIKSSSIDHQMEHSNRFSEALKTGWNVLLGILVFVTSIWPILIISLLSFLIFKRYTRKLK